MTTYGYGENKGKREVYTKEEIDAQMGNKANSSEVYTKGDFAVLKFKASKDKWRHLGDGYYQLYYSLLYPVGFNMDNCVIISCIFQDDILGLMPFYGTTGAEKHSCIAHLCPENLFISVETNSSLEWLGNVSGKVVLMKYDTEKSEYSYNLGDVNGDGVIDEQDLNLINSHLAGETTLTTQQQRAADIVRDGVINEADAQKLQEYLNSLE